MKINEFTLKNGLKVIVTEVPDAEMISSNLFIGVGSRYETPDKYGLSHFLEHMAFKGTVKYPSANVFLSAIDSIGGFQNAHTAEDHTMYWNMVPKKYLELSLDVLAEQSSALLLKDSDIDKERGTVIEEIKRKNDDPYQLIDSQLNRTLWSGNPLECDILGTTDNIKKISRTDFMGYIKKYYVANNIILSIAGDINADKIKPLVEKKFRRVKEGVVNLPERVIVKQKESNTVLIKKKLEQTHLLLAYHSLPRTDKNKYALDILMAIIAGGMSSILFTEIREKRGLAYAIEGGIRYFNDCGVTYINGGFNNKKAEEAINVIKNILNDAKNSYYDPATIKKAVEYLKGVMYYHLDGVRSISTRMGDRKLLAPDELDYHRVAKELEKVTKEDIKKVANQIFRSDKENLIILGPYQNKEKFAKILAQSKE